MMRRVSRGDRSPKWVTLPPAEVWHTRPVVPNPLSQDIADAARELQGAEGSQDTMDAVVRLAQDLVDNCQEAGISLVYGRERIDTPAATGDVPRRVDELQYEFDQGPCLDAIREQESVYCPDLEDEQRWGEWAAATTRETGVRSMLCFRLFTNEETVGALNLYAYRPDAFGDNDRDQGLALAAHAAVAVAAAQEIDQLKTAKDGRTIIGQAQGILMERFDLDATRAFQVLIRVSSTHNRKLRVVAEELTQTRRTPGI